MVPVLAIATVTNNRNVSTVLLYTEQLTYDKKFGKHNITATAVFESQESKNKIPETARETSLQII